MVDKFFTISLQDDNKITIFKDKITAIVQASVYYNSQWVYGSTIYLMDGNHFTTYLSREEVIGKLY